MDNFLCCRHRPSNNRIADLSVLILKGGCLMSTFDNQPCKPMQDQGVASLVLALVGWGIPFVGLITGIIAIVLGHKTRRAFDRIVQSGAVPVDNRTGKAIGRGLATSGFVIGIVLVSLYVFIFGLVVLLVLAGAFDEEVVGIVRFSVGV